MSQDTPFCLTPGQGEGSPSRQPTTSQPSTPRSSVPAAVHIVATRVQRVLSAWNNWRNADRQRQELLYLLQDAPPHILKDVGLSREEIQRQIVRLGRGPTHPI
mgnify:CR=1 FL=1|jgi:Uncharacterized conserved small protein